MLVLVLNSLSDGFFLYFRFPVFLVLSLSGRTKRIKLAAVPL